MSEFPPAPAIPPRRKKKGVTLVESLISLSLLALFMLGFLGAFLGSRQVTESNVMHAAATSIVYGVVEQIKQLDYETAVPNIVVDPGDPAATPAPNVRVRLNQNTMKWLKVIRTVAGSTPRGPLVTPAPTAPDPTVGGVSMDNDLGALPLSTVSGVRAQSIQLHLWIWIDEIPDLTNDVAEVKRITVVYTYSYRTGGGLRTIRNREVFLRTRYDQ